MIKYYNSLSWRLGTQLKTREPDVDSNPLYSDFTFFRKLSLSMCLMLFLVQNIFAQETVTISLGSGTTVSTASSTSTGLGPVNKYYNHMRYQVVYTASEIIAAGVPVGSTNIKIEQFGWNVSETPGTLTNYAVRMANTTASNSASNNTTSLTTVSPASSRTFTTGYNMITLDGTGFEWNGVDNLLVDICTGSNGFATPYGAVFTYNSGTANGSRFARIDGGSGLCATSTDRINTFKPQARFVITFTPPPGCSGAPNNGVVSINSNSGCSGVQLNLSATGLSSGNTGLVYQWQSSPDNSFWTDIASANSSSYSASSVAGLTYYRIATTCTESNQTSYSNSVSYNGVSCVNVNIPATGFTSISCGTSANIYDNGGPSGQYTNNNTGYIVLENSGTGVITISGSILGFETCCDGIKVYSGIGIGGTLLATLSATGSITPIVSAPGQALTIQLFSDVSTVGNGIALQAIYSGTCAPCSGAPNTLAASNYSSTNVDLSWGAPSPAPEDGYEWAFTTSATPPSSGTATAGTSVSAPGTYNPGQVYYLHVRAVCEEGVQISNWTTLQRTIPIFNDACSGAISVSCGSSITTTLAGSTNEGVAVCGISGVTVQNSAGIWYTFTGDGQDVTISTANSATNIDTRLAVYSGSCGSLTCLSGNDDISGTNYRSEVNISTMDGVQYYILLYSFSSTTPTAEIVLSLTCVPACSPVNTNDECATAEAVTVGVSLISENTCSSPSADSYPTCSSSFATHFDSWYSFNTGSNTSLEVSATPTGTAVVGFAIYSGACGSLSQVACSTTGTGIYTLSASTNYYIRVYSLSAGTRGEYTLRVKTPCLTPSALNASSVSTTGANLNWTVSSSSNVGYEWAVTTSSTPPSSGTFSATNTAVVDSLNPSTTYYLHVRTVCALETDFSAWVTSSAFTTLCGDSTVPYFMGFESGENTNCLAYQNVNGGTTWAIFSGTAETASTGTSSIRYNYSETIPGDDWFFLQGITLNAGVSYRLKFKYKASDGPAYVENLEVKYGTSPNAAGMTSGTLATLTGISTALADPFAELIVDFSPVATGVYYIGFHNFSATDNAYLYIDDISVDFSPPILTGFSPSTVCSAELNETILTVSGSNFTGVTELRINDIPIAFSIIDDNTITVNLDMTVTTGELTLINEYASTVSSTLFQVFPSPEVLPITGAGAVLCMPDTLFLSSETPGGLWFSSNEAVATVSGATGGVNVAGVSAGTTTISYVVTIDDCSTTVTYDVTVNEPVEINSYTASQTVVTGNNATFTVNASGTGLSYQWFAFDGIDTYELDNLSSLFGESYSGTTSSSLVITDVPSDMNGFEFYCEVSGAFPCGIETTAPNSILYVGDTGIGSDPVDVSLCDSGSANFTVIRSGDDLEEDITYRWEYDADGSENWLPVVDGDLDGMTISDSDTNVLSISGILLIHNNYRFRAIVTGPANEAFSNPATLRINTQAAVISQPSNSSTCYNGGSTSFVVSTSGDVSSINWLYSTSASGPFNPIANNTPTGITYNTTVSGTLGVTTSASTPVATYYYQGVVNGFGGCSSVGTDVVSLTIDNPTISSQPANASVLRGGAASFSVVTSTPGATIQWQRATALAGPYTNVVNETPTGITYSGADTATLTVTASAVAATGATNYYRAVVSSPVTCSVNSTGVLLTVIDYCTVSTVYTSDYTSAFSTTGGSTNLSYTASSQPANSYSNQTSQNLTLYQGQSFNFSHSYVGGTNGVRIWIDLNKNGVFDPEEMLFSATSSLATQTGSINIPLSTLSGVYRMRVRSSFNSLPPPCGTLSYGSTVDYSVNVLELPACEGVPAAATISSSTERVCNSGSVTLSATGFSTVETGYTYQWYNSTGAIPSATNATYTTPTLTASETYYFRVNCSNSGLYADSNSIVILVDSPSVLDTTEAERCGIGSVTLNAEALSSYILNWYDTPTGGSPIFTGENFVTPSLSETTSFYVAAEAISNTVLPLGTGATNSSSVGETFLPGSWGGAKTQYIIRASELQSIGILPGAIKSLGFEAVSSGQTYQGFYVYIGHTSSNEAPDATFIANTGMTQVFAGSGANNGFTPVAGSVNTLNFGTGSGSNNSFVWDGTSNLVVSFSWSRVPSASTATSSTMKVDNVGFNASAYRQRDNFTPAAMLAETLVSSRTTFRPRFLINGQGIYCSSSREEVVATVTSPPALTLNITNDSICEGGEVSSLVTITSNVGDFSSYTWTPSEGVSGDIVSGFNFSSTTSTVFTLTASNDEGCTNEVTFALNVNGNPSVEILPEGSEVCPNGEAVALVAKPATFSVGTGTAVNGTTSFPSPLTNYWGGSKHQMLVLASELSALGLKAGDDISSISFNVSAVGSTYSGTLSSFSVAIGHTSVSVLSSSSFVGGLTTVRNAASLSVPTSGLPTNLSIPFNTNFTWDGTSNIVVQTSYSNANTGSTTDFVQSTNSTTSFVSTNWYRADGVTANAILTSTVPSGSGSARPNFVLGVQNNYSYTWSPTAGLYTDATMTNSYSGQNLETVYARPAETTVYVLTTVNEDTGCTSEASTEVVVNELINYYADVDGDGFGDDDVVVQACVQPVGYVTVGGDCNDSDNTIYPGAVEICYDGILQNCNGDLNDGCPVVLARLRADNCGSTLSTINEVLRGDLVSPSVPVGVSRTGYRFRLTNTTTNAVREVERPNYVFQISTTDIAEYATVYTVEVAVRLNEQWMPYGPACTVVTPGVPSTVIAASSCGTTLAQLNNIIRAEVVPSAVNYEYEVSLIEGGVAVETTTLVRPGASFNLLQLTGISIKYGAEYRIRVKVEVPTATGLQWSANYGAACSVFSPLAPESQIEGCGTEEGITPATLNTVVYATPVGGATQYRFTLSDGMGYSQVYTSSTRTFRLSNFNALSPLTPGGIYSVSVETLVYGSYYAGKDCNILVPGGGTVIRPTEITKEEETIRVLPTAFKAIAYPNPFAVSFGLDVRTSSAERVSVTVYDMAGRLLEAREVAVTEMTNYQFGDRYPSGVYNVIVTQGEETRTVRVVKR